MTASVRKLQRTIGNQAVQQLLSAPRKSGDVYQSSGSSLHPPLRIVMENRFRRDFARVRIHTDGFAIASATTLGAAAYTIGTHIFFNAGMYRPYTLEGQALLSHELAHVIQQPSTEPDGEIHLSDPISAPELEATRAADMLTNLPPVMHRLRNHLVCRDTFWQHMHQAALAVWRGGIRIALYARDAKLEAEQNAASVGYGYHMGPGDALRHCTWAALTALEAFFNVAPPYRARDEVRGVLLAHEDAISGRGAIDSQMDQFNNNVGIRLAEELWQRGAWDRRLAASMSRQALDNGDLRMIVPGENSLRSTADWRHLPRTTWP